MRSCAVLLLCVVAGLLRADQKDAKPLSPAEAAKHVNEKCTVEMEVKSTGKTRDGKLIFLNSEEKYQNDKNFTVVIDAKAAGQLKEAKIDDPATHFKGKTIRVSGTVTTFRDHPQIKVEDAKQIQVVEKK